MHLPPSTLVAESSRTYDSVSTSLNLSDFGGDKDSSDFFDSYSSIQYLTSANLDLTISYFFDPSDSFSSFYKKISMMTSLSANHLTMILPCSLIG